MTGTKITATGLEKHYDQGTSKFKLGPVTLSLSDGQTIAVLGPNGAGKTTLFELLTGNTDASAGEVLLNGKKLTPDKPELKRQIGYLPQHHALPRWVTGRELLRYAASLHGLENARDVVDRAESYWDCASYRDKPLATLSYGMQKRVALALAMLADPLAVVLDEPFDGLDLLHVKALEDAIKDRARRGKTTILSTHVTLYAARLATRSFIVSKGVVKEMSGFASASLNERLDALESEFFNAAGRPR